MKTVSVVSTLLLAMSTTAYAVKDPLFEASLKNEQNRHMVKATEKKGGIESTAPMIRNNRGRTIKVTKIVKDPLFQATIDLDEKRNSEEVVKATNKKKNKKESKCDKGVCNTDNSESTDANKKATADEKKDVKDVNPDVSAAFAITPATIVAPFLFALFLF